MRGRTFSSSNFARCRLVEHDLKVIISIYAKHNNAHVWKRRMLTGHPPAHLQPAWMALCSYVSAKQFFPISERGRHILRLYDGVRLFAA